MTEFAPAGTVTVGGITTELEVLRRLTRIPPAGAGDVIDTVTLVEFPPVTDVGVAATPDT